MFVTTLMSHSNHFTRISRNYSKKCPLTTTTNKIAPQTIQESFDREQCELSKKLNWVDKRLLVLAANPKWLKLYAQAHCYSTRGYIREVNIKEFTCKDTAEAIVQANIFRQTHFKAIGSFDELEEELKDEEVGVFLIGVYGSEFINNLNETRVFQGHAFTIIKVMENEKKAYRIAQSYVNQYSLGDFLEKKDHRGDFSWLKEKILVPYYSLLETKGPWQEKQCKNLELITGLYFNHLMGYYPDVSKIPSEQLKELSHFGRTTSKCIGYPILSMVLEEKRLLSE